MNSTFCTHCDSDSLSFLYIVTLSADADPAPGGYVVPEGGSITFTCNSSLPDSGVLLWDLDLKVEGDSARYSASVGLPRSLPQVSTSDTSPSANPASFTISNITSKNNCSFVGCTREGLGMSNATIIVEGEGYRIMDVFDFNSTCMCSQSNKLAFCAIYENGSGNT